MRHSEDTETPNEERTYLDLLKHIAYCGRESDDRTGTGTRRLFHRTMEFDVSEDSLPVITTKKIYLKGIVAELCWFLSGETNTDYLEERGVTFWNDWSDDDGKLGPVYGKQLRAYPDPSGGTYDQLYQTKINIIQKPESRRHVITLWNPTQLDKMRLHPCHGVVMQFYVRDMEYLDMTMYQRSGDMFIGVPFNITSYSLLLLLMANHTGFKPGWLYHTIGDAHVYQNHLEQVDKQLEQDIKEPPSVEIDYQTHFDDYDVDHFEFKGYDHGPKIEAPVAV